ncbi:MAG: hypothetical protein IPP69_03595 [Flavobacteriales bacterium]|nr:hypothetical protein [Flavobacteriales bacterium]
MANLLDSVEELASSVQSYTTKAIMLARVQFTEILAVGISDLIGSIWTFITFSLCILSLTIGMALYIGDLLKKNYLGFLVMAGFYLIVFIVVKLFLLKSIKSKIQNRVIIKIMQKH